MSIYDQNGKLDILELDSKCTTCSSNVNCYVTNKNDTVGLCQETDYALYTKYTPSTSVENISNLISLVDTMTKVVHDIHYQSDWQHQEKIKNILKQHGFG